MVVALIECFVYIVDKSACCEMTFIFLPRVFSATTMLSYQISRPPDDFDEKGIQSLDSRDLKDETGQKGPSFAIIIPPSSA